MTHNSDEWETDDLSFDYSLEDIFMIEDFYDDEFADDVEIDIMKFIQEGDYDYGDEDELWSDEQY